MKNDHFHQNRAATRPGTAFSRLLAVLTWLLVLVAPAKAANIIHEFYVPMPDAQIRTALVSIEPASGIVGTTMESVISVVVTGAGSVIHYDEWEDGYEIDLNNPMQATTKIWGDGNNANGIPPGYVNDPAGLASGSVVNLRNQIALPRNPAVILYDGRDRFGGTKALVVTRTGWAVAPGTVLAGSVEVTATMDYDTDYVVPVGQDVTAASMFEYVGLMVMARENGTSVMVDVNGPVGGGTTTFTLNQGESYLVNGGVLKGATVTATKPVQTQLITGDIGARYETDWFTLYPTDQWTGTYFSPVGTAADGDPAYGFFYNPNPSPITINTLTNLGTGSFTVAAYSTHQYQMPQNSGARFISTNSEAYFGIVMVGANPSANNVHDWGFTLVPSDSLTTEAVVGWGPGSSDVSQNGSPVWVTPVAATRIYVDFNGDRLGALTDPKGNKYDAHYDMTALETRRVFDPDKDQSAMRVYSLDGVQIAAAWGQDPASAGPGNPFLDVGTTVLPFPVPTLIKSHSIFTDTAPVGLSIGDTIEYQISVDNKGLLPLGNLLVLDPLHASLTYVPNSTKRDGNPIADNGTGTAFPLDESGYVVPIILRGGMTVFTYRCTINSAGNIANTASNANYNLISTTSVVVPPPAGSTPCGAAFTNAGGAPQSSYPAGTSIYATLTDPDANNNTGVIETLTVVVTNTSNGDAEFVTLTETGANTGIFRNTTGLATSTTTGTNQMDGTLLVSAGNSLSFSYTDPEFSETCSNTATISTPTQTKVLYLSTDGSGSPDQDMDRVDPVAANDLTTATSQTLLATSGTTTVNLGASKDTWINSAGTTLNYGGATTFNIDREGGGVGNERALLQFDLSSIPAGSIITSAQLTLTKTGGASVSQDIGAYRVTSVWDEGAQNGAAGTANWTQRQSVTNWTTAGGDFNATAEATVAVAGNAAYNWNLTSLVQGWLNGTFTNNGILMASPNTGGDNSQQFGSRTHGTPASRPQLTVTYSNILPDGVVSTGSGADPFTSVTVSHTTGTGANRLMLVGISYEDDNTAGLGVSGVTYAGQALTLVTGQASSQEAGSQIWRLVNPPSGTANVVVSVTGSGGSDSMFVGVATYTGVDQTTPLGVPATNTGTVTPASVTTTSAVGELVFDVLGLDDARLATVGGSQTERWNARTESSTNGVRATASTAPGAASVATTWTIEDDAWALCAVSIKPAASPSSTTFSQTPNFASSFSLPAGGSMDVTAYVNVTSGSLPGTPNVTALLKYGSTTIATLTNPTYNSGAGTLAWNGTVGSLVTVPAGQPIDLVVTSNQAGAGFVVEYDSTTRPSKVSLPTTTVITNTALAVYDAPYPGGSIVTGPISGSTVYIRGTASDPFGAYDITSMGLNIDGPGTTGDITTTLGAGNVVNTTAATKTYEYAWTVGATVGTYNIVTTANEGTEGINATRATSVTVTFLDLGTPSTTEFTTGLNGPGTAIYAGNEQVCVRITDLDQNLNPLVAETITAVITSLVGDSELVTLTETGVDTGIFVVGIPASTSAPNTHNNGTLHAVLGDVLTVNYVDPTDPTDTGTDTATIPNIAPAVSVNKTLVTPADGQAVVGEALQYTVQVTNTGNTTLNTISLVDTFPAADLTYVSASITPNTVASGSLTWNNVGPLTQGQSVTITLNFTALTSAAPAINTATANAGGGVTSVDTASVTITDPEITLTKTLLSPNPGPANIGANVVFRIVVQNTGDTAIATLPLEDTYSGADFDFVSATVAPSASGSGSLLWLDVTGAGNLAVGNSITIDVTLQAKGAAAPATNLAAANYTVDVNGDSMPPVSSSAIITLIAAKISGHVYDDVDQSASFNVGDGVLQSITVSLYTDPNGDGNPADGTLLDITTTDANGAYEFLNLPLGDYVIVESQPPGYSSSGDTGGANDNRIPVDVSTLTTFANRDFFDFLTPPVSYASIAGKVWNDADASATVNGGEVGIENVPLDLVEDTNGNGVADPGEPVVASTLTAADGAYSFGGLSAGNYAVVEHDLFGWYSTADATAPNNNMIPVVLAAGANITGRDFLDVVTGTVSGLVYFDANANGAYNVGIDVPLANVDVIVTDSQGNSQTVSTNAGGNWTVAVPPGSTSANVDNTDVDFVAAFVNVPVQTEGSDPTSVTAVSGSNVSAGNDGYMDPGIITGTVLADTDNDDIGDAPISGVVLTLLDSSGNIIDGNSGTPGVQPITATTNGSGVYTFSGLTPGVYQLSQAHPSGYQSISDRDGGNLDIIGDVTPRTVDPGETDSGNNFVEEQFGSIQGHVFADTDNNDSGDAPIVGVVLTLLDVSGAVIDGDPNTGGVQPITATTDINGAYVFNNVPPGAYRVGEAQPLGYQSISDEDGGNLDQIGDISPILVTPGGSATDRDFVEEQLGAISGTVFADTNNDNAGDMPMENVSVTLFTDPNGDGDPADGSQVGGSVLTNASGVYTFSNIEPGSYVVLQTQPAGYITVSDADTTTGNDDAANASALDNRIPVGIAAGESDDGNSFVEEQPGTISGTVAASSPLPNVSLALFTDPNGDGDPADGVQLGSSVLTNGSGVFIFTNVPPGDYVLVQSQPSGYVSVSDGDTTVPGDDVANGSGTDNRIPVSITANETDDGNNFTEGCPTITVNPASLPNGVVGSAYNQTLSASGGTAPYTFAVTAGTLPAGLTLGGATISGIPTSTTSQTFTVTATDNLGCTGTRQYTVEPVCPTITVNPSSLPDAIVGSAYSQTVSAIGGTAPYTFAVTGGALPAGVTLSGDTLSGIPTAAGTANFTITATDNHGCTGSRALSITSTCPTVTVSPVSLSNGVVGSAYSETLSASGGTAPYTFAVTTGTLPAGLTLVGNTISGIPTSTTSHNFTITATDANNCAGSRSFTVAPVCPTISLTSTPAPLAGGTTGTAYSGTINASGGTMPYTFAVKAGSSLPAGLSLSSGGAISGTPTASGGNSFIIVATDANGCEGEATFTISVSCPTITVTPGTLSNGVVGTAYGPVTFSQTGGTGAITWSQTGALPAGMSFNVGAAQLGGTPTEAGGYNITIIATDVNGCVGSVNLSFSTACPTVTVNPASLPDGVVGTSYSEALFASGGTAPYTYAVTAGALPAGLSLAGNTISGIPTSTTSQNFTITATDDNGCTGSRSFTIASACPTITVNPATLPDAVVGTTYNQTLSAVDGTAPYTFAVTAGSLPPGLSLSGGVISGTPTAAGTSNFTVTVTDTYGCTGTRALSIVASCPTITVSPASLPDAVAGTAYNQSLSAGGGTLPYTFAVTAGSLPAGLSLDSGGVISGTPTAAGTSNFTVTVTDNYGCAGTRSLSIVTDCPTVTVSPVSLPNGVVGTGYSETLSASGGTAPYSFAVTVGSLPAGLNLVGDTITGTPTSTASHNFTITATDANNCTGSRSFTVAPTCPTISLTSAPAPLPGGTIGAAYSGTINASGGTPVYSFALKAGSSLPPGLNLSSGGAISGTPTASGGTTFTVVATDLHGCEGEAAFTISVGCPTITVTPGTLSNGVVGTAYGSVTFNATGGAGAITWQQTGALPAGMTFDTGTAQLAGTPTEVGSYNITVSATDTNGCIGSVNLSFSTSCPAITVNPAALPGGSVGTPYSQTLSATGGTAPYTFAVTVGALPSGVSLAGTTISGTPDTTGTANFTITATDANGCTGSRALSIVVQTATISGTVFADTDNDGDGDVAIVGALVALFTDPNGDGDPSDGVALGAPIATIAGGTYTFAGVPPGDYVAVLSLAPGRLPVTDGDITTSGDDSVNTSTTDRRIPVSLVAGESDDGNDFIEEQSGNISGAVLEDTDNDNIGDVAMPGILVLIHSDPNGDGNFTDGHHIASVFTDSTGNYSFTNVEPGHYVIQEQQPPTFFSAIDGDQSDSGDDTPNADLSDNLIPVTVNAGETDDGNLFLEERPGTITGCVHRDLDNDDDGDQPIFGTTVTLFTDPNEDGDPSDGAPMDNPHTSGYQPYTDLTDPVGVYFFNPPPGTYVIVQTQPIGYLTVKDEDSTIDISGSPADAPNFNALDNQIPVTIKSNETDNANNFVEEQSVSIGNLVWVDENNDGVKDAGENGLDNVTVELLDGSGNPIDSDPLTGGVQPTTALTAGGGLFSFADLAPGDYQLRIATPPPSHPLSSSVTDTNDNSQDDDDNGSQSVAGGAITSPVFTLTAGESDSTMDFGLVAAATLGNLVWHDANNDGLRDGGESGIGGIVVELLDSFGNAVDDPSQASVQAYSATTNGSGAFSFTNLVPGSYRMRIATPPAAQPMSSVVTDSNDNGQDDDDNGDQAMPTAATLSPLIALAHGETENTVDFGFVAVTGTKTISGQVRDDYDQDGSFSDLDQPVASVTVTLHADTNGNGSYDVGIDQLLGSTTTDGLGNYLFTGLVNGTYFVQEVDPRPASSTADTDGVNDNLIKVVLAGSGAASTGNDFLDAVDPAGYIYDMVTGQIIGGGSINVSGPGTITITQDGSSGQYSFITDTAGTYTITYSPPLGYIIDPARPVAGPSFDPTGGPDPTVLGSAENPGNPGYLTNSTAAGNPYYLTFDLAPGDPFVINNNIPLRLRLPKRYVYWKVVTPGGGPNPGSNGDGDCYIDLIEYALHLDPSTGVQTSPVFRGYLNSGTGKLDATFVRTSGGLDDVTYALDGLLELSGSPGGWTALSLPATVVDNGDGTETVTFADLESDPFFAGSDHGMVRLRVMLDENNDTVPELTANTPAFGWTRNLFQPECVMSGHPYLKDKVFCGTVDAVVGNTLDVTTAAGGASIVAQFVGGRQYFVEVFSGDNEGHRFEVNEAASTATTIALDAASVLNTLPAVPASLAGDKVVIREHWTLNGLFSSAQFGSTNSANTGDRLMFYNRGLGAFDTYWLFSNAGSPKWVLLGDAGLVDQGARIMDPGEGWFTHPRNGAQTVVFHGMIRANDFALPLQLGPNFIGSAWPMNQSPAMRGMSAASGFAASNNPINADQILFWKGHTGLETMAYYSHFLLNYGALQQWSPVGNATLANENNLLMFRPLSGAIMKMRAPLPGYQMPMPWTP